MVPFSNISLRLSVYFRITSNFNYFLSASISLLFLSFEYVSDTFTSRGLASKWNKILNGKKNIQASLLKKNSAAVCLVFIFFLEFDNFFPFIYMFSTKLFVTSTIKNIRKAILQKQRRNHYKGSVNNTSIVYTTFIWLSEFCYLSKPINIIK